MDSAESGVVRESADPGRFAQEVTDEPDHGGAFVVLIGYRRPTN
ncbi:hypothetical protein GCM10010094_74650 [Streptomyces flaveus]|uniref:Uncharacterized protein n=1 Tax=Streptomyces flaveus TaxID=66370 RepID=A0A917RE22_9ACTN|nr:hypothetical protein GCM10010094_74650 [Streptomyces flaveus]